MRNLDRIRLKMELQEMLLKKLEHELSDSQLMDIMKEVEEIVRNFESLQEEVA